MSAQRSVGQCIYGSRPSPPRTSLNTTPDVPPRGNVANTAITDVWVSRYSDHCAKASQSHVVGQSTVVGALRRSSWLSVSDRGNALMIDSGWRWCRHRARVCQAVRLTFFCFSFRARTHFSDWRATRQSWSAQLCAFNTGTSPRSKAAAALSARYVANLPM